MQFDIDHGNIQLLSQHNAVVALPEMQDFAISIDGRPEMHNALRGRADSFSRAEAQ